MASIFHIALSDEFDPEAAVYAPAGLEVEGFIHCSRADQLAGVIERYYSARFPGGFLCLLELDVDSLGDALVWEDTTGRGEDFPHVHGVISRRAIRAVHPLLPRAGSILLPASVTRESTS